MPSKSKIRPWFLFTMEVSSLLAYLERKTGRSWTPPARISRSSGFLHLNVGIPGIEEPIHPLEENPSTLARILERGDKQVSVILSGEWEVALREGLISRVQLRAHERALRADMERG